VTKVGTRKKRRKREKLSTREAKSDAKTRRRKSGNEYDGTRRYEMN
jgi:hypothetical protein